MAATESGSRPRGSQLGRRVNDVLRRMDLSVCDPDLVISLLSVPSIKVFCSLHSKLRSSGSEWLDGFLSGGGMVLLLEHVHALTQAKHRHVIDVVTSLTAVTCVRGVMTSHQDCLLRHKTLIRRLVMALDWLCPVLKRETVALLGALCAHSPRGLHAATDALHYCKAKRRRKHRLGVVMAELRASEEPPYQASVMTLINGLLSATTDQRQRLRMRHELDALDIDGVMTSLDKDDVECVIQCRVYTEMKAQDDERQGLAWGGAMWGAMWGEHRAAFNAVLTQVEKSPESEDFLKLLRILEQFQGPMSASSWKSVVKYSQMVQSSEHPKSPTRDDSQAMNETEAPPLSSSPEQPEITPAPPQSDMPPPPTPDVPTPRTALPLATTPADLPNPTPSTSATPASEIPPIPGFTAPPPPPLTPATPNDPSYGAVPKEDYDKTPTANTRMKHIAWKKLPASVLSDEKTVWWKVRQISCPMEVDFVSLETMFTRAADLPEHVEKPTTKVSLLDSKRSMAVNIYLKQFKMSPEEVVALIAAGDVRQIGNEKLRGLLNLLPSVNEIQALNEFKGTTGELGRAELFLKQVIQLPSYKFRVAGLVLMSEFARTFLGLESQMELVIRTMEDVLNSQSLVKLLRVVLTMGNFMNKGSFSGGAAGFELSSLCKLVETKSVRPRYTALHYLVEEAERDNKEVLAFTDDLAAALHDASRIHIDELSSEVKKLATSVNQLDKGMSQVSPDVQKQFSEFLQLAKSDSQKLDDHLKTISSLKEQVLKYFCYRQGGGVRLEECFTVLHTFNDMVAEARRDNHQAKQTMERQKRNKSVSRPARKSTWGNQTSVEHSPLEKI